MALLHTHNGYYGFKMPFWVYNWGALGFGGSSPCNLSNMSVYRGYWKLVLNGDPSFSFLPVKLVRKRTCAQLIHGHLHHLSLNLFFFFFFFFFFWKCSSNRHIKLVMDVIIAKTLKNFRRNSY
jgi:hypothetical protein